MLLAAYAFGAVMLGTTLPTPLYPRYERVMGFSPLLITVIFAVYAFGVVAALLCLGGLSDRIGRRPALLAALTLSAASGVAFLLAGGPAALLVGRALSGLSAGIVTGAGTAAIADLAPPKRSARVGGPPASANSGALASGLATAANLGGLGCGNLLSGALAASGAAPLRLPFLVDLALLGPAFAAVIVIPETVRETVRAAGRPAPRARRLRARGQGPQGSRVQRSRLRGQGPQGSRVLWLPRVLRLPRVWLLRLRLPRVRPPRVPAEMRGTFVRAAAPGFASFAMAGLFSSLAPTLLALLLHLPSPALAGAVVFAVFGCSAAGQLALGRIPAPVGLAAGCCGIILGAGLVAAALTLSSLGLLIAGAVVAGLGQGLSVGAGLSLLNAAAPPDRRGEVASGYFVLLYLGLSIPIVGMGLVTQVAGLRVAGLILAGFVVAVNAGCLASLFARRGAPA